MCGEPPRFPLYINKDCTEFYIGIEDDLIKLKFDDTNKILNTEKNVGKLKLRVVEYIRPSESWGGVEKHRD